MNRFLPKNGRRFTHNNITKILLTTVYIRMVCFRDHPLLADLIMSLKSGDIDIEGYSRTRAVIVISAYKPFL